MLAKPNKVIPNPLQCSCFGKENPKYNNNKKKTRGARFLYTVKILKLFH